jgi:hypothetical protein
MSSRYRLFFFPIVLLVVSVLVVSHGLNLPFLAGLLQPTPKAATEKSSIKIWANKRSGLYYCPDSKMYGKLTPGVYMSQGEAIQGGYQPAASEACH